MSKNTTDTLSLLMPGASWPTVKRIIRAYGAASGDDSSAEEIAQLGGLQRTVISGCNKFLRSTGIVHPEKNRLTDLGAQLSTGWSIDNQAMVLDALQAIVASSPPLFQMVNMVRARGSVEVDLLKGQIIGAAGLRQDSFLLPFVKTIIDLLEESRLVSINDDVVSPGRVGGGTLTKNPSAGRVDNPEQNSPPRNTERPYERGPDSSEGARTPLPLGPNRLGYIELPKDWNNRELPKLIKMLSLIFGEDDEVK
ncbi:MAG: hypothetical protein ABI811_02265 [Acidobacteriota bacterium]